MRNIKDVIGYALWFRGEKTFHNEMYETKREAKQTARRIGKKSVVTPVYR